METNKTTNEMTEFEQEVYDIVKYVSEHHDSLIGGVESYAKRHAKMLLLIAIEQTKDEIKTALLKEFRPKWIDCNTSGIIVNTICPNHLHPSRLKRKKGE